MSVEPDTQEQERAYMYITIPTGRCPEEPYTIVSANGAGGARLLTSERYVCVCRSFVDVCLVVVSYVCCVLLLYDKNNFI